MMKTEWLTLELRVETTVLVKSITEHFTNFNINFHFADFEEYDKLFDRNFSATCSKLIPQFTIWWLFTKLKAMLVMSFIVHIFVALFICSRIHFVCLLNDFTEVYSYLWMAVYVQFDGIVYQQIVGIPMGPNCAPLRADLFYIVMRGTLCLTFTNLNVMTSLTCLMIHLDILTIYSPSITLNFKNIFPIYIQQNFS